MLTYKYTLQGGNLISINVDGEERQYQPMEGSWQGQDVVIFPFVARLINQTYMHNNVTYSMKNHGLARYNKFILENKTNDSDTLLFKSNEETKKQYPFDFELRVIYKKENNKLQVSYFVKNIGEETMPFGIGGHPAIKVPYKNNDTKGNYIDFDKEVSLTLFTLDDSGSFIDKEVIFGKYKEIELDKAFFQKYKTFIIGSSNINYVFLKLSDGKKIRYDFNSKFLALWSHPSCGDYICVEPWDSLPDFLDNSMEINKKKTLIHLNKGSEYNFTYTIDFID